MNGNDKWYDEYQKDLDYVLNRDRKIELSKLQKGAYTYLIDPRTKKETISHKNNDDKSYTYIELDLVNNEKKKLVLTQYQYNMLIKSAASVINSKTTVIEVIVNVNIIENNYQDARRNYNFTVSDRTEKVN